MSFLLGWVRSNNQTHSIHRSSLEHPSAVALIKPRWERGLALFVQVIFRMTASTVLSFGERSVTSSCKDVGVLAIDSWPVRETVYMAEKRAALQSVTGARFTHLFMGRSHGIASKDWRCAMLLREYSSITARLLSTDARGRLDGCVFLSVNIAERHLFVRRSKEDKQRT